MCLARVGCGVRREDGDSRFVCKFSGTVQLFAVAAGREEVLEMRHVGRLVHLDGKRIARGLPCEGSLRN